MGLGETVVYSILLIEDNPADAKLIGVLLDLYSQEFEVSVRPSLAEGLEALDKGSCDAVLLDLNLGDSKGFSSFSTVRDNAPRLPLIVISGTSDVETAIRCVREGAQDYLVKGRIDGTLLGRSILFAIARNQIKLELENQAFRDELTGLYNRRGFKFLTSQLLKTVERLDCSAFVLFVDVNGMKTINDEFGHAQGDKALCDLAKVLQSIMRGADIVARMGGDEFVVLGFENVASNALFADRIHEALDQLNATRENPFNLSVSIGGAGMPLDAVDSVDSLLRRADRMMYRAKTARNSGSD